MKTNPVVAFVVLGAAFILAPLLSNADDTPKAPARVKLFAREVPLTVLGRTVKVLALEQENGEQGYSPSAADGFHVTVVNQLPVPTSIHWHGLILPPFMDGVPFVSQDPIPPGGTHDYDFPLQQAGTYWMHTHYGLQEQQLLAAPLIIRSGDEPPIADHQITVMLSDFSFKSPGAILKELMGEMGGMKKKGGMKPMKMAEREETLTVQKWDAAKSRLVAGEVKAPAPDIDVKYDALLANRKTLDSPEIDTVQPGQAVLLRLVAASSATNFFIDTGALDATVLAADGEDVQTLRGNFFQLAIAQRLDLLVSIPRTGGIFPILARGEGTTLQAGIVLATPGADLSKLAFGIRGARTMGALDNTQELRLQAKESLPEKPVQRTLPSVLGGSMAPYSWTINGKAYPNRDSLDVKQGERVEMVIENKTGMSHPMHLHGHIFQVVEIDGQKVMGAVRDTISVPPKSTIKIVFDANNPGVWAYHCHIAYHLATGMFTVLKYEGADTRYWQPSKARTELENSLDLSEADEAWRDATDGLLASHARHP